MNWIGVKTLFMKEIGRTKDVAIQSFLSPVISTLLYFIVFGNAVGARIEAHHGVPYAAFIVPGLILMAIAMNALMAASSGLYFPRFVGTIDDLLSAPLSAFEIALGFALAASARSLAIGMTIFGVASLLTEIRVAHPFAAIFFSLLVALTFSIIGLILGVWAKSFEQLSLVPTLIITPLSFLGGIFYSIDMLHGIWKTITHINPIFYMVDGLRWSFFTVSDTSPLVSLSLIIGILTAATFLLMYLFKKGYGMKA